MNRLLFLVFIFLYLNSPALGQCPLKIGYGSSAAVLPKRHIEQFYLGFETALRSSLTPAELLNNSINIRSDDSYDGAYKIAKKFGEEKFDLIVGFASSHEAILAEKGLIGTQTVLLSAGAATSDLGALSANSKSIAVSMKSIASTIYSYTASRYSKKSGVIILSQNQLYGSKLGQLIVEEDKTNALQKVILDKSGNIPKKDHKTINNAEFIIFSIYPNESEAALKDLKKIGYLKPIIGNTSWSVGEFDMFKHILKDLGNKIILPEIVTNRSVQPEVLVNLKKQGFTATTERLLGYDAGVVVSHLIRSCEKQGNVQPVKIRGCYEGTSMGAICFTDGTAHGTHSKPIQFIER